MALLGSIIGNCFLPCMSCIFMITYRCTIHIHSYNTERLVNSKRYRDFLRNLLFCCELFLIAYSFSKIQPLGQVSFYAEVFLILSLKGEQSIKRVMHFREQNGVKKQIFCLFLRRKSSKGTNSSDFGDRQRQKYAWVNSPVQRRKHAA